MREDSKPLKDNSIIYDDSRLFRAVKNNEPASWIDQDELIWQAQYYDEKSITDDNWERGSHYATPDEAIAGAKRGKSNADVIDSLFK